MNGRIRPLIRKRLHYGGAKMEDFRKLEQYFLSLREKLEYGVTM